MKNDTYVLFIFEGRKTEPQILESLKQYFLSGREHITVKAIFGATIYSLYKKFFNDGKFDDDLDTFMLAREMENDLEDIKKEQVAEIYLFFDYDSHASNASDKRLEEMLVRFDNETDKGKLYISYPMVEALRHTGSEGCFSELYAKSSVDYKRRVQFECQDESRHFNEYNREIWLHLIELHAKKANFLLNQSFTLPESLLAQQDIFQAQMVLIANRSGQVAVLSAFPLFLLDYLGVARINSELEQCNE